jgi:cell division septation protein DedD
VSRLPFLEFVLKTRLLGAFVLLALLVLFVPMFFPSNPPTTGGDQSVSLAIPPAPDRDLQTKTMSLNPDAPPPAAAATAPGASPTGPAIPAAQGAAGNAAPGAPQDRVFPPEATGSPDQVATVNIGSSRPRDVETDPKAGQKPEPTTVTHAAPPAAPSKSEPLIKQQTSATAAADEKLAPATAARGNYSLNLSAYASNAGAQSLERRVRALGYPSSSRTIHQGGKPLTLVSAGPFATRTAAESARLRITQSIKGVPARLEGGASTPSGDEPAPAAAAPATPASGAHAGGWAVQVAAMGSQSDANGLRDKLRANGFDGFVDSVSVGGKRLWRVRAGPQTQREDAARLRDQIKAKLGLPGNIVSVP